MLFFYIMKFYSIALQGQGGQNLKRLPATYSVYGSKYTAWVLIIFSTIFWLEAAYNVVSLVAAQNPDAIYPIDLVWFVFFVIFISIGVSLFFIEGEINMGDVAVKCAYKTIFGNKSWQVPYSSYKGLQIERGLEGGGTSKAIVWRIRLIHPDNDKSFTIHKAGAADYLKEDMEFYQQLFGLKNITQKQYF